MIIMILVGGFGGGSMGGGGGVGGRGIEKRRKPERDSSIPKQVHFPHFHKVDSSHLANLESLSQTSVSAYFRPPELAGKLSVCLFLPFSGQKGGGVDCLFSRRWIPPQFAAGVPPSPPHTNTMRTIEKYYFCFSFFCTFASRSPRPSYD